jgi:hypothetical protein
MVEDEGAEISELFDLRVLDNGQVSFACHSFKRIHIEVEVQLGQLGQVSSVVCQKLDEFLKQKSKAERFELRI